MTATASWRAPGYQDATWTFVMKLSSATRSSPRAGQPKLTRASLLTFIPGTGTGRLLIRKSGTEPVIRVMAEGEDERLVETLVEELAATIAAAAA